MVSGGMSVVKYLLFVFNFVFFVSGVAIIIVGALVQASLNDYDRVLDGRHFTSAAIILIVVGSIVAVIAFFGCCGAIRENHCMVITFAVFLGIIFILELAAGISAFVYKGELKDLAESELNVTWAKYNESKQEDLSEAIDSIQSDLRCCGVSNYTDWALYEWGVNHPGSVPDSCCIKDTKGCGNGALITKKDIYTRGCYTELKDAMIDDVHVVAGVGIGVAFIQLVGMVFACCLASAIRRNYEVV